MKTKKTGKLIKQKKDNFKIQVGTLNHNPCSSIYLNISGYFIVEDSVRESIDVIKRKINANKYQLSKKHFDSLKYTLIDYVYNQTKQFDIPNKKSYFAIEFTFFDDFDWKIDNQRCFDYANDIIELLYQCEDHFSLI
jgi:hypothetical protein